MNDVVKAIVAERRNTHGNFVENTVTMQKTKEIWHNTPNWKHLPPYMREALDMIAHKIGRVLHGDPMFLDHWIDQAGYIDRVVEQIDAPKDDRRSKEHAPV